MPKISVIVPVYKVEKYINRCVDSILKQTYEDFELILVDDGSPDRSGAICDEYSSKDGRVVVVHQENMGLSFARNAGLRIAKGSYISFVDSDDCIHERMFEKLLEVLLETDADMVKSNYTTFFDSQPSELIGTGTVTIYTPGEALKDFFRTTFSPTKHMKSIVWDALYKREVFIKEDTLALKFPVGKVNEDTYLFPEMIIGSQRIAHVDLAFYFYFVNLEGITHSSINEKMINSCDLWEHVYRVVTPYTREYMKELAFLSVTRYLTVLRKTYYSDFRQQYFHKIRKQLLLDREHLTPHIADNRVRRALFLIRIYPIYLMVRHFLGKYVY